LRTGAPAVAKDGGAKKGAERSWFHELWMDVQLRSLLSEQGVRPARDRDFPRHSSDKVELGRLLFFDKELSGNRDVSCATCHHPLAATADGLSLPAGVGGHGLSTARAMGEDRERVPRNAPDVFNRGHESFTVMFWDGRVEGEAKTGFRSPAGSELPDGLETALAVQAMFPVTSPAEMRGNPGDDEGENELADATSNSEVWAALMKRLLEIPEYADRFADVYPGVPQDELGFEHAANAIAAFEATAWRADDSPFDRYLRGDRGALNSAQKRGALLFYGKAECSSCHSGTFQTDHSYHAVGMAQFGPGKGDGPDGDEDYGREQVTHDPADRLAFRTPSLRNVALTGPWGHVGAYGSLEAVIDQHRRPARALRHWDRDQVLLPVSEEEEPDLFSVMDDPAKRRAIARASEIDRLPLKRSEVGDLVEFLNALTDPSSIDIRADVPTRVPSGAPLAD
jgi:cytochrome c peroxidase